jgi:FO synthase
LSLPADQAPLSAEETARLARDAVDAGQIERVPAERIGARLRDPAVRDAICEAACELRWQGHGDLISVSRNIFVPLTNLCRNRCAYCTFAKPPGSAEAKTYTVDEVAAQVRGGIATGCIEALFCLGDKPEIAYRSYRDELAAKGYGSTTELLVEACKVAFEGGMLPHTNAGILTQDEMAQLRPWNASMGLMLETTSQRLRGKGMAHQYAPDKDPKVRLRMHAEAGELEIPFTSGILLGIGENDEERVDTLFAIRDLAERYGHIQEVIIQPFHPKPGTPMRAVPGMPDDETVGWVALARLIFGAKMHVQAPPNLAPEVLERLLASGLDDWGGVSPVTVDFINPEAPWPQLRELRERTESAGLRLVERLPTYPEFIVDRPEFFDPQVRAVLPRLATDDGWARSDEERKRTKQSGVEAA